MATATLDGRPLLDDNVAWELRAGTSPVVREFLMAPYDAAVLVSGSLRPVKLKIESPGHDGVEISNLYVIEDRPGPNPKLAYVRVADRRWFWSRVLVRQSFNMRRNLGIRRVEAGFDQPAISPLAPDVRYAPWSMNSGQPWSAEDALLRVWETIRTAESESAGISAHMVVEGSIASVMKADNLPMENVELADNGEAALRRILDFIPGSRVVVDADGTVRVYSVASGKDRAVLDALPAEQDEGGHVEYVTNNRLRPREVRVFFEVEPELRFDYEEVGDGGTVSRGTEDLWADNVLAVPDYSFDSGGTTLAQGTWLSIGAYLRDMGAIPNFGKLSKTSIRRASVPFLDLWSGVRLASIADDTADWASRVGAIEQHYRRTYQINPRITERVRSYRAYRAATIHPQTGTRAPATAYQDWAVVATQRFLSAAIGGGAESFAYAQNFTGYPSTYQGEIGQLSAAPIDVSVRDSDQGIVHLEFRANPTRTHEVFLPSKVDNIPTGKLTSGIFAWNAVGIGRSVPELSATHRVAFILTVSMGAPNSKKGLVMLRRNGRDVAPILPSTLRGGINDARGPAVEILVRGGWETARVAWVDRRREEIMRALGLDSAESEGNMQSLVDAGLVVNLGDQAGIGTSAASLDAIANSVAASVYAEYADRYEGERTSPVTHKARVEGFIESVMHQVLPDGEASTKVTMAERQESPLDLMSMMPSSTRAIILKLQTSGKGAG